MCSTLGCFGFGAFRTGKQIRCNLRIDCCSKQKYSWRLSSPHHHHHHHYRYSVLPFPSHILSDMLYCSIHMVDAPNFVAYLISWCNTANSPRNKVCMPLLVLAIPHIFILCAILKTRPEIRYIFLSYMQGKIMT
jgi:hypothetical protein